jgi:putative membrane protein
MLVGPPSWQGEGDEPDYRFSLANERTFLAWIRTALSLLAGSIALVQLAPDFNLPAGRTVLGALLAVAGSLLPLIAYRRWAKSQRAMRNGWPLPASGALLVCSGAFFGVGVIVLVLVLTAHPPA